MSETKTAHPGSSAPPIRWSETLTRPIAVSFRKSYVRRVREGFMDKYLSGPHILDIGFRGGDPNAVPISESAIGVELDYPGYDGITLPFADNSQDAVLAAHVLEHIQNWREVVPDWFRVLRVGGFLVIMVPHRYLYERRADLPSFWNGDHKRFYTPASLLTELESCLPVNGFRVRHLVDNDINFPYDAPQFSPPAGNFEIELVIEKIARPEWSDALRYSPAAQALMDHMDRFIYATVATVLRDPDRGAEIAAALIGSPVYFPHWFRLSQRFVTDGAPELGGQRVDIEALRNAVRPLLKNWQIDAEFYVAAYADLQQAQAGGDFDPTRHWRENGYFDGRIAHRPKAV